jgi:nucleoside-diphosphate-sugar epimerase
MAKKVLLFGGTGRTGLEIARQLTARGDAVTAMARPAADCIALEASGAGIIKGNPLDESDVTNAFASGRFDAVISTLGHRRGEPEPRADVAGIAMIIAAAKEAQVSRMLMVTMIGSGDSIGVVSEQVIKFLGKAIEAKTAAEAMLESSGLDYTILRPGGLNGGPNAGTGIRTADHNVMGVIAAGDLARLVIECLDDDDSIGKIYHTIDPTIEEQAPLQRGESWPSKN